MPYKNREDRLKNLKEYYQKNKEVKRAYNREYGLKNKDKIGESKRKYNIENMDKIRLYRVRNRIKIRKNRQEKINNDDNFKLRIRWRGNINHCLRNNSWRGKSLKYLGCSVDEYKKYIESKWKEGMRWTNRGVTGWHIDHIIPLSKFELSNEEERFKAFNYKNTQPLWFRENLIKRDK